jgi:hypothetical protein
LFAASCGEDEQSREHEPLHSRGTAETEAEVLIERWGREDSNL